MTRTAIHLATAFLLAASVGAQERRPPAASGQTRPARQGHVDAGGGVRLFYSIAGSGGDTVIVLHGGPGFTSDYLDKDLGPLARRHTLIFFDQRGTGRSTLVTDSAALDAQRFADDVEAVRRHFGLRRVALFGHSWGAAIAALYATRHPDRVSRILLLGAVPPMRAGLVAAFDVLNSRRDSAELRLLATRRAGRAAAPSSAEACRAYYVIWFRPAFTDAAAARRSRGDFCFGGPASLANKAASVDRYTFASLGDYDWRPALRSVNAPTLVVQGPWEFMPLDATREWVNALPNARLLQLEQGGHFAYLDASDEFFAAAHAFLSGGWPARARGRQPEGFPPDDPDSWRLAGTAKVFCSAIFVSGRDSAEARRNLAPYFLGPKLDSITAIRIDRTRGLVRLTLANRLTREAKRYGDQGCVIHQPGKDSVYFAPVRVATALPDAATMPWPMGHLPPDTSVPASIDTVKVRQATDAAFANPAGLTAAFVVVHDGRIIAERYANGAHRDMQLESWSMGKSITGTLVGRLVHMGALKLEDPAPIPNWRTAPGDPRAKIRIVDLMRMSSGLRFSRGGEEDFPGYHDHDLIYTGALDAFEFVSTRPLQFSPNTRGRYRNTDPLLLGLVIRDAVRQRGENYLTWPQRELFDKLGIRRQVLETDPYGNFLLSGYDYGTARNWARLGMLYLNDGVWNGERLLPEGWTTFVSTPAPAWADSAYGGMVWVNARGTLPLPRDAFAFRGAGGQETWIIPSRRMVIVRMGHFPGSRAGVQDLERSMRLLMEAVPAQPSASRESRYGTWTPAASVVGGAAEARRAHAHRSAERQAARRAHARCAPRSARSASLPTRAARGYPGSSEVALWAPSRSANPKHPGRSEQRGRTVALQSGPSATGCGTAAHRSSQREPDERSDGAPATEQSEEEAQRGPRRRVAVLLERGP